MYTFYLHLKNSKKQSCVTNVRKNIKNRTRYMLTIEKI